MNEFFFLKLTPKKKIIYIYIHTQTHSITYSLFFYFLFFTFTIHKEIKQKQKSQKGWIITKFDTIQVSVHLRTPNLLYIPFKPIADYAYDS